MEPDSAKQSQYLLQDGLCIAPLSQACSMSLCSWYNHAIHLLNVRFSLQIMSGLYARSWFADAAGGALPKHVEKTTILSSV